METWMTNMYGGMDDGLGCRVQAYRHTALKDEGVHRNITDLHAKMGKGWHTSCREAYERHRSVRHGRAYRDKAKEHKQSWGRQNCVYLAER